MVEAFSESLAERAAMHRALGDERRLRIVDCLAETDRAPGELSRLTGMSSNLLAFHLRALEEAGIVARGRSEGDSRRRYVHLRSDTLTILGLRGAVPPPRRVVFVCTHNSARSQFAEALWRATRQGEVWSAGTEPAERVHPQAVTAARNHGVDLTGMRPKGYEAVPGAADLVITVCDRAFESGVPLAGEKRHWSIPDPVGKGPPAFTAAFAAIAARVERLGVQKG